MALLRSADGEGKDNGISHGLRGLWGVAAGRQWQEARSCPTDQRQRGFGGFGSPPEAYREMLPKAMARRRCTASGADSARFGFAEAARGPGWRQHA